MAPVARAAGRQAAHVATVGVTLWQIGSMDLAYRIVNVFTVGEDPSSSNPLAVFEDAAGVSHEQMQAIARQLNLSQTAFVTASTVTGWTLTCRIFTPSRELPFAGYPTLGYRSCRSPPCRGTDQVDARYASRPGWCRPRVLGGS